MGILDFREICSANVTHRSVKDSPEGISNSPDDFELFCQEFFTQVKRFKIFRSSSKGPDLGIDLGVEEHTEDGPIKWLVSCKHYAHSGNKIPNKDEKGIVERVGSWECDGFIPFYTGVPNSSLSQQIQGAQKFVKVERYYKDRIEQELLENASGTQLASRYFPKSMSNHYKEIITPTKQYTKNDITIKGNIASLNGSMTWLEDPTNLSVPAIQDLIEFANIEAGFKKHKPYYNEAIKEVISLYPEMFEQSTNSIEAILGYKPTWNVQEVFKLTKKRGLSEAYFIFSVWSFWDHGTANELFADFMLVRGLSALEDKEFGKKEFEEYKLTIEYQDNHYNILKRGLLLPGFLGIKLQDSKRNLLTRLLAFAN